MRRVLLVVALLLGLGVAVTFALRPDRAAPDAKPEAVDGLEALFEEAPDLDPALQARLWQWNLDAKGWPSGWSTDQDEGWYLAGKPKPLAGLVEEHERLRAGMDELSSMLDTGRAYLSSIGWLREALAEERDAFDGVAIRIASGAKVYAAARWYAYEAMTADDPQPALAYLTALHEALDHGGSIHDHAFHGVVGRIRDRTVLRLLYRSTVPEMFFEDWAGETSGQIDRLAQSVRQDRLLYTLTVAEDLAEERHLDWDVDLELGERLRWWWQGQGDVAAWLNLCASFEDHLEGVLDAETIEKLDAERVARRGRPYAMDAFHAAILEAAVVRDADHRLPRVAAYALRHARRHGTPPRDAAHLREIMGEAAGLLDAGWFRLALTYEADGEGRFTVRIDPDTPMPDLVTFEGRNRIRESSLAPVRRDVPLYWSGSHQLTIRTPRP